MSSIEKMPNGRYRARWRDDANVQRAKTFEKKREAESHLARVAVALDNGTYVGPDAGKVTVAEYARSWASVQPWRQSSRDRIEHVIASQIVPKFGDKQIRRVRRSDVAGWVATMTTPPDGSRGLAPSTVESYFRVLASIFRAARADRLRVDSPCDGVKLPRAERTAAALVPLTIEQVHAISDAVPRRYRGLVLASAGLGLRQGEACGLTVDRVDFLRRTVRIDRQLVTPKAGAPHFGQPKTAASNRVIPLAESVAFALSAHLEEFEPGADGLLFTSSTGEPVRRNLWSKVFGNAAKAVGVDASSHDLRHHAASVLLSAGVSIKSVQSFLGHATAAETLDTYGHLMPGDDDRLRAAIDAASVYASCTEGVVAAR